MYDFILWIIFGIFFWLISVVLVYQHGKEHNIENLGAWVSLTFFTGLIGLIIYVAINVISKPKKDVLMQSSSSRGKYWPTKEEILKAASEALDRGDIKKARELVDEARSISD